MKTSKTAGRAAALLLFLVSLAGAQTTRFSYQGTMDFSGAPANGSFDFEFALFDAAAAGGQVGATQSVSNVSVTNGSFTVNLDFGSQFPGADRFLEIRVRQAGQPAFTTLNPRQRINSAPYALKSLAADTAQTAATAITADNAANATTATNALALGGAAANQYVQTNDPRLSDARPPTAGSTSYIQNQTAVLQPGNFAISGNGTLGGLLSGNVVSAVTQYNIDGDRILSKSGTNNFYAGPGAGLSNTAGTDNAFFGTNSGAANTSGAFNAFFGTGSGAQNTTGFSNSIFGAQAGVAVVGGNSNSFFGRSAGGFTTAGSQNSFFGINSGNGNTTGNDNTFIGSGAGAANSTGFGNTALGFLANLGSGNLTNATAIGDRAVVAQSNSLVLGSISGINGAASDTKVGIGTVSPTERLHVVGNGLFTGNLNVSGTITGSFSVPAGSITGILGPANGGTGLSSVGGAGSFLRSNGSVWASAPISPADIPAGSAFYIHNGTAPQGASNFNISGNGTAGGTLSALNVNSTFEFRLGGQPFLNSISSNSFFGVETGSANFGLANTYTGYRAGNAATSNASNNSFFGANAGRLNSNGNNNAFFGTGSGENNTFGGFNAFYGATSGNANTSGNRNVFVGVTAGRDNTVGSDNTFVGGATGQGNVSGNNNSFFGSVAGTGTTTGSNNSFFGRAAGNQNVSGTFNTAVGDGANFASGNLSFATAIGSGAIAGSSNTVVLGRPADTVQIPGSLNVAGSISGSISVPASNITGVLGPANGGTGLSSVGAAGTFLRSNGTSLTNSPILASDVPAGSPSYIQNQSTAPQASSNFNISGTGVANIFSATQFNIGGDRVLSAENESLAAGVGAASSNTTGSSNVFVGFYAGSGNTTGSFNTYVGSTAGFANATGDFNVFVGSLAGGAFTSGSNNTAIGTGATFALDNLTYATAIGSGAISAWSNSVVLGRPVDDVRVPGFLTVSGVAHFNSNLNITDSSNGGLRVQTNSIGGTVASFGGNGDLRVDAPGVAGGRFIVKENGNVGVGTNDPVNAKLQVNGRVRVVSGDVFITNPNTLIITSPNGACWGITVNNSGALSTFPTTCP